METVENLLFDSRINRCKKHKLESIILIVLCATLKKVYGYQKIAEFAANHAKELEDHIDLSNGCPSSVTLWRNFERLNIRNVMEYMEVKKDFLKVLINFQSSYEEEDNSYDRKKIKGHSNLEVIRSHINHNYINICDRDETQCNPINKQRTVHTILEKLVTKKSIIAIASKYNNPHTAHIIKKYHGDYLLKINKSNKYLFEQIKDQLDRHIQLVGKEEDWYRFTKGKESYAKARRFYRLEHQLKWVEGIENWPQAKCMIAIEEKYYDTAVHQSISSINYYLSSIKEWSVEKIHELTEYHFLQPCSWIISFEINCMPKVQTTTKKILKSNLIWIQNGNSEID